MRKTMKRPRRAMRTVLWDAAFVVNERGDTFDDFNDVFTHECACIAPLATPHGGWWCMQAAWQVGLN